MDRMNTFYYLGLLVWLVVAECDVNTKKQSWRRSIRIGPKKYDEEDLTNK
jgi:hypothetical protein